MNGRLFEGSSRREFLKHTGRIAAAATIVSAAAPYVHAAEDNTIRVALVGCGGRGTGAAADALIGQERADPVGRPGRCDSRIRSRAAISKLSGRFGKQVDVPEDRRFVGFDGYQKAMDCLQPGDVVILGTPPVFRWVHFKYAMDKGPQRVHGEAGVGRCADVGEDVRAGRRSRSSENQKVGVGLMCRHCRARGEMFDRIKDGEIGDLTMMRAYRMAGRTGTANSTPRSPTDEPSELIWQIKRFHSFLWASGGAFSDFLIHNIDECCWMKDAWPVKAQASGGRHYRGDNVDQNFDNYSVEYTFADGAKLFLDGRTIDGCYGEHSSYRPRHEGLGHHFGIRAHAVEVPAVQEPGHDGRQHLLGLGQAGAESVPDRMGRSHRRDPRGQAVQRNRARHRGQPAGGAGSDGGPHRAGDHARRAAEASTTSSRRTSTS